jgi:hypothetical protein
MATFDQLSAEQRAIIELVLKRGQSYEELGDTLGMPTARVRKLARAALVTLSPVSAAQVDEDWRGPIADYLLGQQSGSDSTSTRSHLRRSETARAWSRSLLDSLDQFYDAANLPTIPSGDGGPAPSPKPKPVKKEKASSAAEEASPDADDAPRRSLSPKARAIVLRRRIAGAAAVALVILIAILVWPVGVLTGGDDDDKGGNAKANRQPAPRVIGQLELKPVEGAKGVGVAAIAQRGKRRQLIVQARVAPNRNREAYEVWLYNSDTDARSLGAQVTDRQGTYQGAGPLPADFARFKFIDFSREAVDENRRHGGRSVLRGRIADFVAPPPPTAGNGQTQTQP